MFDLCIECFSCSLANCLMRFAGGISMELSDDSLSIGVLGWGWLVYQVFVVGGLLWRVDPGWCSGGVGEVLIVSKQLLLPVVYP